MRRGPTWQIRTHRLLVRSKVVYVPAPIERGSLLVPFGQYDGWSLRNRYNEAIQIMNTLGAATISCETFGETTVKRVLRARLALKNAEVTQQKINNRGFDYHHDGTGSPARDPRPLLPDEPGFSAAVSSGLDNGATSVAISIRSGRLHSVDGSLGLSLRKQGFDLGGSSQESE